MKITVGKGESLAEALGKQNIVLNLACGGAGTCGGCMVEVERFGRVKACRFRLPGVYEVAAAKNMEFCAVGLPEDLAMEGLAEQEGWDDCPVIAADIGTTTVAMVGFYRKKQVTVGFANPQRAYGADVISRIRQANEGRQSELTASVRSILRLHIQRLLEELGASCDEVQVIFSGNTAMLHLLFGMDCGGLGKAPFQPQTLELIKESREYKKNGAGTVFCHITALPGFSAFVGADIVSGCYALSLHRREKPVFFIDLGTNGELALSCKGAFYVASAAAGPAFEGNELAEVLYGAGMLRLLCKLLQNGVIDKNGTLAEPYFKEGYPAAKRDGRTLSLTQDNIRNIQLAKAAIRAGIDVLMQRAGICPEEIDEVFLAGGMGYFIRPEDAVGIGMLPEEFSGKTRAAGNASLLGAVRYARECAKERDAALRQLRAQVTEVTLAGEPLFAERFIACMDF